MTTFYDAAVALLAGKKLDKSEADRVVELVRQHTTRPELQELDSLRARLDSAIREVEEVQSSIGGLSYDFTNLDRTADTAMSELEEVREAIETLAAAMQEAE
jgi:methyl-accepting chemotaxis protein